VFLRAGYREPAHGNTALYPVNRDRQPDSTFPDVTAPLHAAYASTFDGGAQNHVSFASASR
jgi:hypothetical protein